jgi:transcriptional regulator with XRE-family HTH domain
MEKIIKRLIKLRKHRGLSQRDMANKLEVNLVSYSKYERGLTSISVERLQQIADLLEVDITYFFFEGVSNNELIDISDTSDLLDEKQEEDLFIQKEFKAHLHAVASIIEQLINELSGLHDTTNPYASFYSFLRAYLKGNKLKDNSFSWFLDFIQIYDINKLQTQYKEYFDIILFEDNYDVLSRIERRYYYEKNDDNITRLINDWNAYLHKKLYFNFFSNNFVFSFIEKNEKEFKALGPVFDYNLWLEYKKLKVQG